MKPNPSIPRVLALLAPVAFLTISDARADIEAYLLIPTIPGESTAAAHSDWMDIQSFSMGAVQRPAPGFGLFDGEIIVAKRLDKASPKLFLACALGTVIPAVTIDLTDDFGPASGVVFYQVILSDVLVASVNLEAATAGTDRPVEVVSFICGEIEIRYSVVDETTGVATPETPVTWNYVNQTP